jgi:hypothetical protein
MLIFSIRPLWLSISVITMVLMILTAVSGNAQEMGEGKGLKVTILLYSGRPDPTYIVNDKETIEQLRTLISAAKPNEKFEKYTVIPSILGYRGIIVDNPTKISGIPVFVAVYKGNMEVKDEGRRFLIDEGSVVENLLLKTAIEKRVIEERMLGRMKKGY